MSEQLDDELRKRISEVFEHYEDTAPAEEGWELLRQKFPQEKKRRMLPVWWSAAAVFLLLCTLGIWLYNQPETEQTLVKQKPTFKPAKTGSGLIQSPRVPATVPRSGAGDEAKSPSSRSNTYAGNVNRNGIKNNISSSPQISGKVLQSSTGSAVQRPYSSGNAYIVVVKPPVAGQRPVIASTPTITSPLIVQQPIVQTHIDQAAQTAIVKKPAFTSAQAGVDTSSKSVFTDQSKMANQNPKQNAGTLAKKDSVEGIKKTSMAAYLANEQKRELARGAARKDNKLLADKKVLYNVYAATYFNYANGSSSQVNTGAGFGTDIKLSSHFKLSTGLAIGKNTLSYNGQPTQANIQRDAVSAGNAAAFNSSANVQAGFSSVPLQVTSDAVVAGYNVSLTGLDVPVNIKYEFNPKTSDSYISAGLSSGTFINESYNYRYVSSVNALGATNSLPDANSRKSFTNFDFARTLNLSLGMGYQITKSNRLIIEPFVKYPLSGLGSQQIRFGSSGINLRLKFQTKK